ncbi:hypothetical protein IWW39_000515 [Coemansia spiralis]|uniref:SET domain-containing protein n=1 Tax=Coemansia spiralis TaxID=417178 RepID=A0A9W8GP76_9FUNG|nr:hypothetical protein IWW39_000515 [Coemansia spiralis]
MAATTEPIVDAHAGGDNGAQASKKKKAKKVVADNTRYQGAEAVMPILVKSSHAKGRYVVSSKELPAGTLVTVEKASAAIVRNQSFVSICHHCLKTVPSKTQTRAKVDEQGVEVAGQTERVTVPAHSCDKCKMAAYCSEACQRQHAVEHGVQCDALARSNAIAAEHRVPLEHLRSLLALVGRRFADDKNMPGEGVHYKYAAQDVGPTPYSHVLDLNPNRHYLDRSAIKSMQQALKEVLALVPEAARISLPEAVEAACIFNTNHHSLMVNGQQALGVFPFSSLYFQHSCSPNCMYVGENGATLYIRTLTDVAAGTELTIPYVELYQPREQRRRDLLMTRHFWCKCKRCSTLLSNSVDRLMDGIQCTECKSGVMIFEETKEVQDINELITDMSALDQEIQGKFAECEACPAKIEVTKLVDVLKAAITDYSEAHMALQRGEAARARTLMEAYLRKYEDKQVLSPFNTYLVNTYISLFQVCAQLGEVDRAIRYNAVVIERMEGAQGATPENYPRLAEYHMAMGDMCLKQAKLKAANQTPAGRSMARKYFKDARPALEKALKARTAIYGKDSPRAYEVKRLLDEYKKEHDEFVKATDKKKVSKKQIAAAAAAASTPPPPPADMPAQTQPATSAA